MRWSIEELRARRFELVPLVATVLAAAGVWIFLAMGQRIRSFVGDTIAAQTYEFLLLIVLGSAVSVLFQTISYGRELRERRRALQREIHDALVSGYNDAKRARRLLRARARNGATGSCNAIDSMEYDRQMEALSTAQLSIELATRRVEMNRKSFAHHDEIIAALKTVADYLNCVIDEWEDTRPHVREADKPLPLSDLPQLDAFLQHYDRAAPFREGFKKPFDRALVLLGNALLAN